MAPMRAPIVDTRGILKQSCCASCARGGPCAGSAPAPGHDDHAHAAAPGGACCGSCASGGTCESEKVPPLPRMLPGPQTAYLIAQVPPDGGAPRVSIFSEAEPTVLHGERNVVLDRAQGATFAEADQRLRAAHGMPARQPPPGPLVGMMASAALAAPTPRRRVTRDARGALRRTKLRDLGAGRVALFWGPSDAEEAAFQAMYKRFDAILEHRDPATGQLAAALMKVRQPTIGTMLDEWISFASLWLNGKEDPEQLSTHSKNLAIIEGTARDLYGYQKPKGDVVVPLPQDSPILGGISDAGEVLEQAGVPMPDPHSAKGLDLGGIARILQSAAYLAAIAGGLYVAAPIVRRLAMRRAA